MGNSLVDIDDEEKQVSGVDWSLSWERVGRGWDWKGGEEISVENCKSQNNDFAKFSTTKNTSKLGFK